MRKTDHIFLAFCCLILPAFFFNTTLSAQKRQPTVGKKPSKVKKEKNIPRGAVLNDSIGLAVKPERYLALEPCARETPEQIAELENAADKDKQLIVLINRIAEKDDWLRACSIYRLGEFGSAAQDALPVIIKLLRDEENREVRRHVEDALWKIPPDRRIPLAERLRLARDGDVYQRLYAVYALGYFKPIAGSLQSADVLNALAAAVSDEDPTVARLAVTGIRQLGFYGIDTSQTIPVLAEMLKNGKLNPLIIVRAFVPMGERALPAAPLLFDILYNPKKYTGEKDENNRLSALYLTAAMTLGKMGKPLVPVLENEFKKKPLQVLEVLRHVYAEGTLPIFYEAMKHADPEVRRTALENLPGLTSTGAIEALPHLLEAMDDAVPDVRAAALGAVGNIVQYTADKSPELELLLKKKAVPALIAKLTDKESACTAALNLGYLGAAGEAAIPALVRLIKKYKGGDVCAESALYRMGEKGRKFLTAEQIRRITEFPNFEVDFDSNKAKPIKPKEDRAPSPAVPDGET